MIPRVLFIYLMLVGFAGAAERLPVGRSYFREYGEQQGLQNPSITALTEDAHGYLYVGTTNGLYRYNGARFEAISLQGEDHSPWVLALVPHPVDGIWVGTQAGLAFVHGNRARWARLEGESHRSVVNNICVDPDGRAWVHGPKGLYRQGRDDRFTLDTESRTWGPKRLVVGHGPVVATAGNVLHHRKSNGAWIRRPTEGCSFDKVFALASDDQGVLWATLGRRVMRLEKDSNVWQELPHQLPETLLGDAQYQPLPGGGLALLTLRSLVRITSEHFEVMDRSKGLPEEELLTVFEDRRGTLWMGGNGLFRRLGSDKFQVFTEQEGLLDRRTWCVHRSRSGRLFVATHRGIVTLENGRFRPLPGMGGIYVQRIIEDPTGGLWFVSNTQELYSLRPGSPQALKVRTPKEGVSMLLPRPEGGADVLLPLSGINYCADLTQVHRMSPVPNRPKVIPNTFFRLAFRDPSGRIAVSSSDGLHVLDKGIWHSFRKQDGLLNDNLLNLRIGPDGTYWITYLDVHGVTRARLEGSTLRILSHEGEGKGLPTDAVYDTLPRPDGGAWVLTNHGLVAWHANRYRLFTTQDGIGSNDCNEGAIWEDEDGSIWFGTTRGLVRGRPMVGFDPPPSVRLTGQTTSLGTRIFPHDPPVTELPYRGAEITFSYAPRRLSEESVVRYQVCLSGHDQGWYDNANPSAHYTGLREGTYTFLVRGRKPGESWGPEASLTFRILPPWYRTWWAWTLWCCSGAGILMALSQLRLHTLTHQRNLLNQEVLIRTREIQEAREALEVANEALRAQTITDPLTHLKNRRFLDLTLPEDLARAAQPRPVHAERRQERSTEDLVFLLVDLDRFKVINDTHGHAAGDEVLRQAAGVLKTAMRDSDALVRWGGEEFLLLARNVDRRDGGQIAERIRSLVATHPFEVGLRSPLHITCSVGFAPFPLEGSEGSLSWERVVDFADQCLYLVKRSGRNGWMGILDGRHANLPAGDIHGLQEAMDRGELEVATNLSDLRWE